MNFIQGEPRSRTGLLLWFFAQWIVIPLWLALRTAPATVLMLLDHQGMKGPGFGASAVLKRAVGPGRLRREWSRDGGLWEAHLDRKLAELRSELDRLARHPGSAVRWDGQYRPLAALPYWYLTRDDFGTLPLDRILTAGQRAGLPGWQPAGKTVQLRNVHHQG
ncbi:hypothetical protein ACIA8O_38125 [Kitasatospora sp. NPDC051853]|uniref:hypothetical protein n=1 Tax=Kitasatospora sp. NPDC051853 TaxID=3364058 RepID=UPI0037B6FCD9